MFDDITDIDRAIFAKTVTGQQEIQSRALKLGPLPRRLLILIDGKRDGKELAPLVAGHDLASMISHLIEKNCIEHVRGGTTPMVPDPIAAPPAAAKKTPTDTSTLPPAATRSAKEVEMARNFMTNTVNTVFQPNTRLTLLEAIFACKTVEDVRKVYPKWVETISSSAIGTKRLPEFREKLFKVL